MTPRHEPLSPAAPPPAAAPPVPPPTPPAPLSRKESSLSTTGGNGIQSASSTGTGRAASQPIIRNYGSGGGPNNHHPHDDDDDDDHRDEETSAAETRYFIRGDATLRPNVGRTNSYDYALFGWAPHELLGYLRYLNLLTTTASMGSLLAGSWLYHVVRLELIRLVLSIYLGFFCFLVWTTEVVSLYDPVLRIPKVRRLLVVQFGILVRPLGKSLVLLFMASLCVALRGVWNTLLGLCFAVSGTGLLYAWCTYPELRQQYSAENDGDIDYDSQDPPRPASWSYYSSSSTTASVASLIARGNEQRAASSSSSSVPAHAEVLSSTERAALLQGWRNSHSRPNQF